MLVDAVAAVAQRCQQSSCGPCFLSVRINWKNDVFYGASSMKVRLKLQYPITDENLAHVG